MSSTENKYIWFPKWQSFVIGNCKPKYGECTNNCSFDQGASLPWCNRDDGWESNCECEYNILELNEWKSYYGFYQLFTQNLEYGHDSDLVSVEKSVIFAIIY